MVASCKALAAGTSEHGVGTTLARLLKRFGIRYTVACGCESHVAEMDRRGAWWCLRNIRTIAGWLGEEAMRRGWRWPRAVTLAAYPLVLVAISLAVGKNLATKITRITKRDQG